MSEDARQPETTSDRIAIGAQNPPMVARECGFERGFCLTIRREWSQERLLRREWGRTRGAAIHKRGMSVPWEWLDKAPDHRACQYDGWDEDR